MPTIAAMQTSAPFARASAFGAAARHRRQVYAVCALICLRGALAFRRYAAALARANASAVGSAPVPAFPETRSGGRYPLRSVSSLPSSSETGRHAGRAVAQSRPGAVCETVPGRPTSIASSTTWHQRESAFCRSFCRFGSRLAPSAPLKFRDGSQRDLVGAGQIAVKDTAYVTQ